MYMRTACRAALGDVCVVLPPLYCITANNNKTFCEMKQEKKRLTGGQGAGPVSNWSTLIVRISQTILKFTFTIYFTARVCLEKPLSRFC